MTKWSNRRIFLTIAAVLLAAIIVPPYVTMTRFSARIATAIGNAVGRKVTIGKVALRLFPEPGLNLENVTVADDASLSAEPMLSAGEVTATLRLSSLWRGRLEIGKLSLKYPSMNLVRGADGRWNIEALLEQARKIPSAPTAKVRPESRPRFPYIEAEGGRINFKLGLEKKVYALSEADFALWLESENQWGVRFAGRPVRTDSNLSDTGMLKLSGSFERAANLHVTPLQLRVEVARAQLGQLTTLVYGRDRGWRGSANAVAMLRGTPAALNITADATVDDFRRYDILSGEPLRLQAHCAAAYSTANATLSSLNCRFPMDGGTVRASGGVQNLLAPAAYDFSISAENLPAEALVVLARHVKKDLPQDLAARGSLDGALTFRKASGTQAWAGTGVLSDIELRSNTLGTPLALGDVNFVLDGPGTNQFVPLKQPYKRAGTLPPFTETVINFRPFAVPLGATAAARAHAWFSSSGYSIGIRGDGRLQRLLQVAHGLGLRAPESGATGAANFDFEIAGGWFGFAAPTVTGTAQLHGVTASLGGVAAPLQITSAELVLVPGQVTLQNIAAGLSGTHVALRGWVRLPRGCETLDRCPAQFELSTDQLSTDDLNALLNPRLRARPWYDVLGPHDSRSVFSALHAQGHFSAARMLLRSVVAKHVVTEVKLEPGKFELSQLHGEAFGGVLRANCQVGIGSGVPAYTFRGQLERASMAQVAGAMGDDWATGTAEFKFEGTAAGWTGAELAASAAGSLQFDWRDGTMAHVALAGPEPPLLVRRFSGRMSLHNSGLEIAASKLETPGGIYKVSGTASFVRQLGIRLLSDRAPGFTITGPLEKPQVAAATPASQASLK